MADSSYSSSLSGQGEWVSHRKMCLYFSVLYYTFRTIEYGFYYSDGWNLSKWLLRIVHYPNRAYPELTLIFLFSHLSNDAQIDSSPRRGMSDI